MKIFIVGLPSTGRTTISKALSQDCNFIYIDPVSWLKSTFRGQYPTEHEQQYQDSYNDYLINRLKLDPDLYYRNINDLIKSNPDNSIFVIDGLANPKDFIQLFDYNNDHIIFLNRIDNEAEYKSNQNIAISVIKDYCFWLASLKLLDKNRWLEFNFSIPGDSNNDVIKKLGIHNTVILAKSIRKVILCVKDNFLNS